MKTETIIQKLEEQYGTLDAIQDNGIWLMISARPVLTEEFIRKYDSKLDWIQLSLNQSLSETFILEYEDRVNWFCISLYQPLSFDFIMKKIDKLDLNAVLHNDDIHLTSQEKEMLTKVIGTTKLFQNE